MYQHGFVRVAACTPALKVADCAFNAAAVVAQMQAAGAEGVAVMVLPELGLTGYTCADLFQQGALLNGALSALHTVVEATRSDFTGLAVVGLPLALDDQVFNCAAVLHKGAVLGVVPKSFLPNYKEFYEGRWFAPAATARSREVDLFGQRVPFGADLLFAAASVPGLVVGVE